MTSVRTYSTFVSGNSLFGINEGLGCPVTIRVVSSLPQVIVCVALSDGLRQTCHVCMLQVP
jgi:hypothetical protein